jgi:hypothetical protein
MSAAASSGALLPFIFVGCWNRRAPPRNAVAEHINHSGIINVILGGDNVYPLEGTKSHSIDVFHEGVGLFTGKNLYAVLGNHNVKEPEIAAAELAYRGWMLPAPYYKHDFDDVSVIFLDTNIMENDSELTKMIDAMKHMIGEIKSAGRNYYIVQHEPFASYKKKKRPVLPNGHKLLYEMKDYPPLAILCADTHNFQISTLNVGGTSIKQYVVGTGGAKFDNIEIDTHENIQITDDIQLKFEGHMPGYGYLVIAEDGFHFVKVTDWEKEGGRSRGRKTRRRTKKSGKALFSK